MHSVDLLPDESAPFPPRFWWLRRILLAAGLLLILLVVLRLWWGWYASRQLQAEIDRIVAAGEPIYPEDFDPTEDIPDDQNAARMLRTAAEGITLNEKQLKAFSAVYDSNHSVADFAEDIGSIFEDNRESFRLVRSSREFDRYDWGVRLRTPAIESSMAYSYSAYRQLAKYLCIQAEYHYSRDEHDLAIESLLDGLFLEKSIASQPTLISQLVVWAINGLTVSQIERFAIPTEAHGPKTDPARIRLLIQYLQDDSHFHAGLLNAFLAERMFQFDILKELGAGTKGMSAYFGWQSTPHTQIPDWFWRYGLEPVLILDMIRVSHETTQRIDAIRKNRLDDAVFQIRNLPEPTLEEVVKRPFYDFNESLKRAVLIYRRMLAYRRLAALGMAIRLYRMDHGRLPERLEELVPQYLAALPMDPQAREPRTFGYLPNQSSPIVYGVSDNAVDDGGQYEVVEGGVNPKKFDFPFFLNGDRPRSPPEALEEEDSQDAGEDDIDGEDEEENEEENDSEDN